MEAVPQSESASFSSQLTIVNNKLDQLLSLKGSVDTLLQLPAKVEELLAVKFAVQAVEKSITEVLDSIAFQSAQYDSLLKKVSDNESTVTKLQTEVGNLKSSLSAQSQEIKLLRAELNNSEQFSRQPNLEIHGFPCSPNENLPSVLGDIAQKIGIPEFQTSEIHTVHRLPSTRGATPVILPGETVGVGVASPFARNNLARTLQRKIMIVPAVWRVLQVKLWRAYLATVAVCLMCPRTTCGLAAPLVREVLRHSVV
ncbi:hypothetical protein HPB47_017531 [Ixodes persulcatus]|uniref:Uncharacterized protein n=1 Tax=Ixodes persulcatus TaxID=34615 RepID=A0AC60QQ32_IXOPE|nr:hypothetical protein HPB47_017531 [Ixodes persulcatus]